MRLSSSIVAQVRQSFVLYAAGELGEGSQFYEVVHVACCYYNGNIDLAQVMVLRDIENNYKELGVYKSSFSYRRYQCCERAKQGAGLGKAVARMITGLARSDYVELSFS